MKTLKNSIFVFALILPFFALSQVGIGTVTPNAQLEIKSTNQATPSNTDGIIIPQIDEFPSTSPTELQDGMMVYVTGNGTPSKGYYYWDNTTTNWLSVSGVKNTLDESYDEGGAGAGRTITATDGAVTIAGEDGLLVTGTLGSGGTTPSGTGTKMFFNPSKAAFRAGYVGGSQWNDASVGSFSTAFGYNTIASGNSSLAVGSSTTASEVQTIAMGTSTIASGKFSIAIGTGAATASGESSIALGYNTIALSYRETSLGSSNTIYTPNSTSTWDAADRLFVIGNGTNNSSRSNALTIYKSGLMNINDEYNMPLTDGTSNQIMQTDGSGNLSWVDTSTDDQNISGSGLSGTTLTIGIEGGTNETVDLSSLAAKNTLDESYDEGGAGAGRTITATDGAVTIAGEDGFLVTGTINSGDTGPSGSGSKLFFSPRKGAFRAGYVDGFQWDDSSIGNYSVAIGYNVIASGNFSVAMGSNGTASGLFSTAMGLRTRAWGKISTAIGCYSEAPSYIETALGSYNTTYTPISALSWEDNDRLFVIGNGPNASNRSNALIIYKNGLMNINDEYNMPLTDGLANQLIQTDGSGNLSWVDPSSLDDGDWTTVGADIERQSGDVYIGNTAATNNDLYISGDIFDWDDTTYLINPNWVNRLNEISLDNGSASDPKIHFTETNTGFYSPGADITSYTANGTEAVRFDANGRIEFFNNTDASGTSGTGVLEIANSLRIDDNEIITNANTALLLQNDNNGDLAVDGLTFYVDSSADRVGFQILTPSTDLHLKQSDNLQAGGGGVTFESALAAINWKIYHSGSAISFAENGVRRAYISASTGAYVQTSDRTLKKNISLVEDNVLSKLSKISVYRYHYLDQNTSEEKTMGVMAQDIQAYFPELVSTGEDGNLGMNYAGLSVVAIQAIKEQQKEIENQRKEIDELKKLVQQLLDKK